MPSSLPKGFLTSLGRLTCSNATTTTRTFTTSSSLSAIGPENPRFIEVPESRQHQATTKPEIKGVLPPPRNIFPRRAGNKASTQWLAATIPLPKSLPETTDEYVLWKRRLAATRRQNLRDSLIQLQRRKKLQVKSMASRSREKSLDRERRVNAPQREDDRLTKPTITSSNRTLQSGPVPDPHRITRLAEKAARVQAKEKAREDARRDALHTLYMHARSFITTEEQLDTTIENIFTETPHAATSRNQNIWDFGSPPTVQEMLSAVNNTQKTAIEFHAPLGEITGKRMKKIAEELTGGKMD